MQMNCDQARAIGARAERVIVIAGPGSGKTRVIVGRIVHLVSVERVDPGRVVVVTFTNAAADEIEKRLGEHFLGGLTLGHCGTLHSLCLKLLRRHGTEFLGLPGEMAVIDEETQADLVAEVVKELGYKGSQKDLERALESVLPFRPMAWPANGCRWMLEPPRNRKGAELVSARYHATLLQNGLVDYASLLAYGLHLLREFKTKRPGTTLADHLLVDEFQDSGTMDAAIYAEFPVEHAKTLVGDPDQSIYAFRGGSPRHLLAQARAETSEVVLLQVNYRCGRTICKAANSLIAHNLDRVDKRTLNDTLHEGFIWLNRYPTEADEVAAIGGRLLQESGMLDECAVLVRTNALVDSISQALRGMGLPVRRKHALDKPQDWQAARQLIAFLCSPENDLLAFSVLKRSRGLTKAVKLRAEAAAALETINQHCIHWAGATAVQAVPEVLARANMSPESVERVRKALGELKDPTLEGLTLALAEEETHQTEEGNGVTVCTIHSAKGREWDQVWLPAWDQEGLPGKASGEALEELRRVAFVALTRARNHLRLSYTAERRPYPLARTAVPVTPSQFLREMGLESCQA